MSQENQSDQPEIQHLNPKDLRLGPIRRDTLSEDQLEKLRAIWQVISPYQETAFETMELNFLRDADPDQELAVWANIAVVLTKFIEQHHKRPGCKHGYRTVRSNLVDYVRLDEEPMNTQVII